MNYEEQISLPGDVVFCPERVGASRGVGALSRLIPLSPGLWPISIVSSTSVILLFLFESS